MKRRQHRVVGAKPVDEASSDALREGPGDGRNEQARLATERRLLANRVRAGDLAIDLRAADEVRRTGWARPAEGYPNE
jgi:hypothetical protein